MLSQSIFGLKTMAEVMKNEISNAESAFEYCDMAHINDELNSLLETLKISQLIIRQNEDHLTDELMDHIFYLSYMEKKTILNDLGEFLFGKYIF